PEVLTGNVGDSYVSEEKEIPGYTIKEIIGEPSGLISETAVDVIYVYTDNSAKLIIQFVDKYSLLPVNSIDLLTYSDGSLINNNPNIIDYYYVRDINGQTERIEQNIPLDEIIYDVKMGDPINVPNKIAFKLYNDKDELLSKIDNGNPDYLKYVGFTDYRAELMPYDNDTIMDKVTVIKYGVTVTPIAIPF
ncbi:MAG: MucBP domain-containing protein, partial [Vagococcus sp.]|uniref:MucBP domain-containing protein n=1 Tax=Vagococcus sp. TaxID=1933889 RepID=UPI002FC5C204